MTEHTKPVLRLTDRLRGIYTLAVNDGAGPLNGSTTFTRKFETPPVQHEAAALIETFLEACKALAAAEELGTSGNDVEAMLEHGRGWELMLAAIAEAEGQAAEQPERSEAGHAHP